MVSAKLCECGCGLSAPVSKYTDRTNGYRKGQPKRFVHGHGANLRRGSFARGRFVDTEGYVRVWVGREHPMALSTGYVFEHRLVLAQHLGRMLDKREVVHHLNDVRHDNRLENLMLFPNGGAHSSYHARRRRGEVV